MLTVVSVVEKVAVLLKNVANLWISFELRLIDDESRWNIDECFVEAYILGSSHADQLPILTKGNWIAAAVSDDSVLIAPLVEFDVFLLLFNLGSLLPVWLKLVFETCS